jgi:hypothetical protein
MFESFGFCVEHNFRKRNFLCPTFFRGLKNAVRERKSGHRFGVATGWPVSEVER